MMETTTFDVIIAGAGPVGLMLAGELRLAGVPTVVLERLAAPTGHSKAGGLSPRTLDVLDQRGMLDSFRDGAGIWPRAGFAGLDAWLDCDRLHTGHPYGLRISQARVEELLDARARALGTTIRRGHQLTGAAQDAHGVTVEVSGPGGPYRLRARYLVGCDGGSSAVRRAAGIPFPGTGGDVVSRLGDVVLDPDALPPGSGLYRRTGTGLLFCVQFEPGVHRVATVEFDGPAATRGEALTLDALRASLRRVCGNDLGVREPRWLSWFTDATRQAAAYREGRVLLAGDAAHVHFPVGGQGLNLGLQDAVNLGWKLAAEVSGWAPPGLLDSYHAERHPAGARVLRNTRAQLALMDPRADLEPLRDLVTTLIGFEQVNDHLAAMLTGVDVRYDLGVAGSDPHPLLGAFAPELTVRTGRGETRLAALRHAGRGLLLDLTGRPELAALAGDWTGRVDTVVATREACPPDPAGVDGLLVRPDGYVVWVAPAGRPGPDLAALRAALTTWFGTRTR